MTYHYLRVSRFKYGSFLKALFIWYRQREPFMHNEFEHELNYALTTYFRVLYSTLSLGYTILFNCRLQFIVTTHIRTLEEILREYSLAV